MFVYHGLRTNLNDLHKLVLAVSILITGYKSTVCSCRIYVSAKWNCVDVCINNSRQSAAHLPRRHRRPRLSAEEQIRCLSVFICAV